ncbi:MAG: hypothetical protein D4R90_00700 [Nitrosopumilales archaeon]|nr:MAG: hypothetical protein D4R90_00700 [Nitrosopumilales archaeon]
MNKRFQVIHYIVVVMMLSTSTIYFVATYQQFTDESGNNIREIPTGNKTQEGTSDLDRVQWSELDTGAQIETVFFLMISIGYIPIGMWMLKKKHSQKPHIVALVGSLSLIVFYIISRTVNLPMVGIQTDVGIIDISAKVLQGGIIAGSSYLIITRKKLEHTSSA